VNLGFFREGQRQATPEALEEQIRAGACTLKLHGRLGTTPAASTAVLTVADKFDIQVLHHSDIPQNESGAL